MSESKPKAMSSASKSRCDEILSSYTSKGADTKDKLLGATFMLLSEDGTRLYEGSAGHSSFGPGSRLYGTDTFTWIASMTKLITATCLMQLVEKGTLILDEDLRQHHPRLAELQLLKGFDGDDKPILEDNDRPITLRQLLTHTSGISYDLGEPDLIKWSASTNRTSNSLTWDLAGFSAPLVFPPGAGWRYGASLDWAGFLLEQLTDDTLARYMARHIFAPLGMHDTGFAPAQLPHVAGRTAEFAHRDVEGRLGAGPGPVPETHEVDSGGSGLFSTAADYARFVAGLFGGRLVRPETLELLFAPQLDRPQRKMQAEVFARMPDVYAPDFPAGFSVSQGLGGVLNMEDVPGKRKAGSMMWSGFANGHWWIDRKTGIAGILVTTVVPPGDPVVKSLYHDLETAVYQAVPEY